MRNAPLPGERCVPLLDGALFAADSLLNTVIDLVDPVSDSIYGTLDAFVDTAVPMIDDFLTTLADSTLFEDFVDDLATTTWPRRRWATLKPPSRKVQWPCGCTPATWMRPRK